ncbi:glycerophosphoryl diester phosphodiesterase membrane domain-containing protein [Kitasatospora fiedleri]|uniref:glycerophosphoryl diester phosphodiesterase membrane domain-containing protein n=1 Tax=Kitasatospora fiedleri TaxID=2991545 RepID=UPI00249B6912|nr:glycerophosphoryl diester phosphodiesterase membrane domain-containing protein [Kitasatospora fiedleri]
MTETPGWTSPGSPEPPPGTAGTGHPAPAALAPGAPATPAPATAAPALPGTPLIPLIPLRPLGFGELMDGAFALVRRNWRAAFGLGLGLGVVVELVQAGVDWWIHLNGTDVEAAFSSFFTRPVAALVSILAAGLLAPVVGNALTGRDTTLRAAWAQVRPRLGRLLGLYLLVAAVLIGALAVPVGLLALLAAATDQPGWLVLLVLAPLPAVWLSVRLLLALPALMLEKQSVGHALKRSWRLVRGAWWRVFALLLVFSICLYFLTEVLLIPGRLVADLVVGLSDGFGSDDTDATVGIAVTAVGGTLAHTVTVPLAGALFALVYADRRIRREALDLELTGTAGRPDPDRAAAPAPSGV